MSKFLPRVGLLSGALLLLTACSTVPNDPSALQSAAPTPALTSDEALETTIRQALAEEESLRDALRVTINAYHGTVLVTGQVPTPSLREQVIEIVRRIPGVKLVHNQLEVGAIITPAVQAQDNRLVSELRAKIPTIKTLPGFDPSQVKVTVENGVVYWMGGVRLAEGHALADVARQLPGVKKVVMLFEYVD